MNKCLTKKQFFEFSTTPVRQAHAVDYLRKSLTRQYETYKLAQSLCSPGSKVLSLGAGGAYPESCLKEKHGADIEVVDFQGMIDKLEPFYERMGFSYTAYDLTKDNWNFRQREYDLVLSCDNIEHLPTSPFSYLKKCFDLIKSNGHIVLVTDNFANSRNVVKLLLGKSILPPVTKLLSPVAFENEGIHRREYVYSEIRTAMNEVGFVDLHLQMTWQNRFYDTKQTMLSLIETPLWWLRHHMIVSARKK